MKVDIAVYMYDGEEIEVKENNELIELSINKEVKDSCSAKVDYARLYAKTKSCLGVLALIGSKYRGGCEVYICKECLNDYEV